MASLRPGQVTSYGAVARATGATPRQVGGFLARSFAGPWWRVVASDGRISTFRRAHEIGREQVRLLRAEGVAFLAEDRVDPAALAEPDSPWDA